MGRNIVLLSDGTGNSAGKFFRTNVWQFYQALDISSGGQIYRYDDGVGSSAIKLLAMLGGAVGWGLKRNLLDLYTFLCRNYREGDSIYGIGFSRGAFTIRVLVKFVLSEGLVADFTSEDNLRQKARYLYQQFRRKQKKSGFAAPGRALLNGLALISDWLFRTSVSTNLNIRQVPSIRFVGVWDTVDAYGLPIHELKRGIDKYLWPLALEDRQLDPRIEKACHALSIDDKRMTYHPLLWDESQIPPSVHTDDERLTQVWFAGVHANVGGGYPDDNLSYVSLQWMLREAQKRGLRFSRIAVEQIDSAADPNGRMYDSRAAFGVYYRYAPRHLDPPQDNQGCVIPSPKIHETVIGRMAFGNDAYAPLSLPADLRIVISDLNSQNSRSVDQPETSRASNILCFEDYVEKFNQRVPGTTDFDVQSRIADEIRSLRKPDNEVLSLIWDTIWWRKIGYFATLIATVYLVGLPFYPEVNQRIVSFVENAFYPLPVLTLGDRLHPILATIVDSLRGILPSYAKPWIDATRLHPWLFILALFLLTTCLLWGSLIDRRIHDRALAAWNTRWRGNRFRWSAISLRRKFRTAATLTLVASAMSAWFVYRSLNPTITIERCDDIQSWSCVVARSIEIHYSYMAAIVFATATFVIIAWRVSLGILLKGKKHRKHEIRGLALWLSNKLRTSSLVGAFGRIATQFLPAGFALALSASAIFALNKVLFELVNATQPVCMQDRPPPKWLSDEDFPDGARVVFATSDLCKASGIGLGSDVVYIITVEHAAGWGGETDEQVNVRPNGLTACWGIAALVLPMRRVLSQPWYAVIMQIGNERELFVFDKETVEITPKHSGEAFFFINDAIVGVPFFSDAFYRNNKGTVRVLIKQKPG